jgi:mannose/fructose/N-acetylgalactosamine-specific phosphotransferase system component IIB
MNPYIVEPFVILNDLEYIQNNRYKYDELFIISNRIKKLYNLFNKNINEINEINEHLYVNNKMNEQVLKILSNSKENIKNEEKEYNKIMNDIYKFDVDS